MSISNLFVPNNYVLCTGNVIEPTNNNILNYGQLRSLLPGTTGPIGPTGATGATGPIEIVENDVTVTMTGAGLINNVSVTLKVCKIGSNAVIINVPSFQVTGSTGVGENCVSTIETIGVNPPSVRSCMYISEYNSIQPALCTLEPAGQLSFFKDCAETLFTHVDGTHDFTRNDFTLVFNYT